MPHKAFFGSKANDQAVETHRTYVLAIGISQYQRPNLNLQFGAADARDIAAVFRKNSAFAETVLDSAATKEGVAAAVARFAKLARREDTLIIYFSGYGVSIDGRPRLVTYEADLENLKATSLGWDELIDTLDLCQAQRQLIIADAKMSSTVGGERLEASILRREAQPTELPGSTRGPSASEMGQEVQGISERFRQKSPQRAFVFAGSGHQAVGESPAWGHGAFTYALLQSLNAVVGEDVTLQTLFASVLQRTMELTGGTQSPKLLLNAENGGEFLVLSKAAQEKVTTLGSDPPDPLEVRVNLLELDGKAITAFPRASEATGYSIAKSRVPILGEIQSPSPIRTVLIDGAEANLHHLGPAQVFSGFVDLRPGPNVVEIKVVGLSTNQFKFSILSTAKAPTTDAAGVCRALVIGTSDYQFIKPNLPNPKKDAEKLADVLSQEFGFQVELLDNPTIEQLRKKLNEDYAKRSYSKNDELLVFVAGHGAFRDVGRHGMGYLQCSNSTNEEPYYENRSVLSFNELRDSIDNIPCEHILVLLDACFGGTFSDDVTPPRGEPDEPADVKLAVSRMLENTTRRYFTSGGKEYVPDAGDDPDHSPFASRLLNTLGRQDRKLITADDIQTAMLGLPRKYPRPKAGRFSNDDAGGNFVFVRR